MVDQVTVIDEDSQTRYLTKPCPMCGQRSVIQVDPGKLARWADGMLVQEVWPEAGNDVRELLMTGSHAACWEQMWSDEDE